jgi:Rod binding domain-containing protein
VKIEPTALFSLQNADKPTQVGGPFIPKNQRLWEQAKALETQFSKLMMDELKKTMPQGEKGSGGTVYADMFVDAVASKLDDSNSIGLGKTIYLNMERSANLEEEKIAKAKAEKIQS